ncbi:MAG: glycosyltransferase family 4 protein [Ignavibacteria bacterium]
MRLVFVTGSLVHGGAERHSITVMNRLVERGHDCHAVYVKNDPSQLERLRPGAGTVSCLQAQRFFDRSALADFAAHLTALQPDAIVAANDYAMMYASLARWLAGLSLPLLATFHSTKLQGLREHVKMALGRCLFPAVDCLVFVSANQCRYWRRRGVWARRIEVVHNGVDADAFAPRGFAAAGVETRRRHGIADGDFVVGMVAVMRPEKNHAQLIDAVAALRRQGLPARALLIGDGPLRAEIDAHARGRGVAPFVTVTGFQEDVRPYVAACDAVALCSVTEAFSLAAVEAMAMGKPVVHSDVGGAREMITDGHDGYLFPVGDTEALQSCLVRLADPARARPMGANARRAAEARFSEAAMVDRYERLLGELCAGPAPSSPQPQPEPAWPAIDNEIETRSQST